MDVTIPTVDAYPDDLLSRKGYANSRTTRRQRTQVKKFAYSSPSHAQENQCPKRSVNMIEKGQAWEILGQDQIRPALSSIDANVLLDGDRFQRNSVATVGSGSSDEVFQHLIPPHLAFRHSTDPPPGPALPAAGAENIPDPKYEYESRRVERLIRSKNLRGMPKRQLLNPKPDSEVSEETRRRRAVKEKERIQRQRDEDNKEKRVRNLETTGVESDRPCYECQDRGGRCIIGASQSSLALNAATDPVSGAVRSNFPNLTSSVMYVSSCMPQSSAPRNGSKLKPACSACRKHRTRCQKTKNAPDGPCDACCDREDKAMAIRQPSKPTVSQTCLDCIKHKRTCRFPSGDTEVVVEKQHQVRGRKDINSFPVYSKEWYNAKSRSEQKKILQHLVDTLDPYLLSGMERPGGPCTRCLSLGRKCMVIKPGSIASTLSPKTMRCSNCLGEVGARIAGPWKEIRECCPAKEGQILSITTGCATNSNLQSSEPSWGMQTSKIPLNDADDGNANQLREFRRKSVRHFAYALPKEALDPYDVSAKMEKMYYWIRRLSDSAFILSDQTYGRLPLSECEVSQLENLTANRPFPTVLDAIHQLLGVSTLSDAQSRIREFTLEAIPYIQVIRAVTSMTVYNVIFQEDPFAHDIQTALIIKLLEQNPLYDPQKAGLALQWHHVRTLNDDPSFQAKLHDKAKVTGELMWNILEPLITLGLNSPTPSVIDDCRMFCTNIAEVAHLLNAEIKARCIQPQIFWPVSGDPFDEDCFESYIGSSLQSVQLALTFGIKRDHALGPPTVYAKSKVTGV